MAKCYQQTEAGGRPEYVAKTSVRELSGLQRDCLKTTLSLVNSGITNVICETDTCD